MFPCLGSSLLSTGQIASGLPARIKQDADHVIDYITVRLHLIALQIDSKKELEKLLKATCEVFIMAVTKLTVEPMLSFITKVTAVRVASSLNPGRRLREQVRGGNNCLSLHAVLPRARCVCRQAACKGCQIPMPCWTRQIQARPSQPWARYSALYCPLPAGATAQHMTLKGPPYDQRRGVVISGTSFLLNLEKASTNIQTEGRKGCHASEHHATAIHDRPAPEHCIALLISPRELGISEGQK